MFVNLTHFESGKAILVNLHNVRAVDCQGKATRLVFSENHAYLVKESVMEIQILSCVSKKK